MARGLRSNRLKANKSKLRSNVFGPVEDARTQRLASKLAAVVAAPAPAKVAREAEMDTEEQGGDKVATAEAASNGAVAADDAEKVEGMSDEHCTQSGTAVSSSASASSSSSSLAASVVTVARRHSVRDTHVQRRSWQHTKTRPRFNPYERPTGSDNIEASHDSNINIHNNDQMDEGSDTPGLVTDDSEADSEDDEFDFVRTFLDYTQSSRASVDRSSGDVVFDTSKPIDCPSPSLYMALGLSDHLHIQSTSPSPFSFRMPKDLIT